jgi:hypothetical protein
MMEKWSYVDVIHSPWCFIEAPEESYKEELERKWNIAICEFNLWEIEDDELDSLPDHISAAIKSLRDSHDTEEVFPGGGSLFFLNGVKLYLSPALKWPQVERILQEMRQKDTGGLKT